MILSILLSTVSLICSDLSLTQYFLDQISAKIRYKNCKIKIPTEKWGFCFAILLLNLYGQAIFL